MGLFVTNAGFWCGAEDFHHGQVLLGRAHGWAGPLPGQGPGGLQGGPRPWAGWGKPWRRLGRDSQVHCCPQDPDTLLIWLLDELVLLHFPWVALGGGGPRPCLCLYPSFWSGADRLRPAWDYNNGALLTFQEEIRCCCRNLPD